MVHAVVLSHYPQYEREAVNSVLTADRVLVVRDFPDEIIYEHENVDVQKLPGCTLEEAFTYSVNHIPRGDWILFVDGDDYMTNDWFTTKIRSSKYSMVKFNPIMNFLSIGAKRLVPKICQRHLDWHSTGTMMVNDDIKFYGNYSLDKQLVFNTLNKSDGILWIKGGMEKRYHEGSRMVAKTKVMWNESYKIFERMMNDANTESAKLYAEYNMINNAVLSGIPMGTKPLKLFLKGYRMPLYNMLRRK